MPPADRVNLGIEEATMLGARALQSVGYDDEQSGIITANLVDAELCGYSALGLARLLSIIEDPRSGQPRTPVTIVHETPVSALIDGGNHVGLYSLHKAADITIDKARASGIAVVGVHNSFFSGRNARYVETISRAGLVCIHSASGEPYMAALGGTVSELGTNPIAFGMPREPDPLILDIGTSAIARSEVVLAARLGNQLPEGVALDDQGCPTRDAAAALLGTMLPFGGHKGFGLALIVQALGLLGGAALPRGKVQDFGFLFIAFDPGLLMPPDQYKQQLTALIERIKSTPRQPGVEEIRIPSERAWRERERMRRDGMMIDRTVYDRLVAAQET
ncbi:MAG: Ldh family oxidoreductase [Rhizobiales bacterium]|nr:Ldh family oxidoreductase [Hyphomicrobiales bacterium]